MKAKTVKRQSEKAENLTRSTVISVRLMPGKEIKFKRREELDFQGMFNDQLNQVFRLWIN